MVLNSYAAASDLCDKRSSIYSSRYVAAYVQLSVVRSDLSVGHAFRCSVNCKCYSGSIIHSAILTSYLYRMGWGWLISALPYGDPWRERRRLFTKFFNQHNADFYRPRQAEFTRKMLLKLLDRPADFLDIAREYVFLIHACSSDRPNVIRFRTIGGIALSLAYGLQIQPSNDPYIELAEKASASFLEAAVPGAFLVDVFPIFQYIPGWVPGARFQSKAKTWRKLQSDFHERPFAATMKSMVRSVEVSWFESDQMNISLGIWRFEAIFGISVAGTDQRVGQCSTST